MVLNTSNKSLSQRSEVERAAREKARGEARELGQRLQSCRASLQVCTLHKLNEGLRTRVV